MKYEEPLDRPQENVQWYDVKFEDSQLSEYDDIWLAELSNHSVDAAKYDEPVAVLLCKVKRGC